MAFGGPRGAVPRGGAPEHVRVSVLANNTVRIEISRILGAVQIVVGQTANYVHIQISRIIGSVELLAVMPRGVRIAISRIIGKVRMRAKPLGTIWTDIDEEDSGAEYGGPCGHYGLPIPTIDGYGYGNQPFLSATEFESGVIRRRRRGNANPRTLSTRMVVIADKMPALEAALLAAGAGWWNLPLVTGTSDGAIAMHTVRLIEPVQVRALDANLFEVMMSLEIQ